MACCLAVWLGLGLDDSVSGWLAATFYTVYRCTFRCHCTVPVFRRQREASNIGRRREGAPPGCYSTLPRMSCKRPSLPRSFSFSRSRCSSYVSASVSRESRRPGIPSSALLMSLSLATYTHTHTHIPAYIRLGIIRQIICAIRLSKLTVLGVS